MSDTYTKLYMQIIFAVKGPENFIDAGWQDDLHKYISGIIKGKGQKPIIVNGMPDHIHAFIGLQPAMAVSDLVRDIKNNATNFINDRELSKKKFAWQAGYGAFSYGHSQIGHVYKYILNQENHHQEKTFKQEYLDFLKKFEVEYEEKYLFDWYD